MTNIEKEIYVDIFKTSYNNNTWHQKYPYAVYDGYINVVSDMITSRSGEEAMYEVIDEVTKRGIIPMACPYEGEFIGYKKCRDVNGNDVIVTLRIPAHAKRSSALSKECRCSEAVVVDIQIVMYDTMPINIVNDNPIWMFPNGYNNLLIKTDPRIDKTTSHKIDKAYSSRAGSDSVEQLIYELGKTVKPDSFDPNRFNECSHGIHFFMTEQEALDYNL